MLPHLGMQEEKIILFLLKAAKEVIKYGADSITIHVREDQRHVNKKDAILLKKKLKNQLI